MANEAAIGVSKHIVSTISRFNSSRLKMVMTITFIAITTTINCNNYNQHQYFVIILVQHEKDIILGKVAIVLVNVREDYYERGTNPNKDPAIIGKRLVNFTQPVLLKGIKKHQIIYMTRLDTGISERLFNIFSDKYQINENG